MHGLFGEIQISQQAHQRRQHSARFRSVKSLNGPAELFGHGRRHLRQTSKRSGSTQLRRGFPNHNSVARHWAIFGESGCQQASACNAGNVLDDLGFTPEQATPLKFKAELYQPS